MVLPYSRLRSSVRFLHYSDIENAHDDPDRIGRIAGLIGDLRGGEAEAFVCGTGDNVAPGVLPLVTRGEQALDLFEAISPTVSTFGNHDFDYGPDRLRELVDRSPQEWISANVYDGDGRFADVSPWTIRSAGEATVGFVGVTDPTTPNANPEAGTLRFTDPIAETRQAVAALNDRGVDTVVVLSHLGRGDERLATACDVDLVLGGHVHTERVERVGGAILTRPGSGGDCVLEVDLASADGEVIRHPVAEAPVSEPLAARYRDRLAETGLGTVVGRADEPIRRSETEAFRGESRVGNFVADAYRWAAERELGTDPPVVSLQNSGGIRTGPALSGAVTVADLVSLVPFEEPVVVLDLSGADLLETFREAADTTGFGEADWWHAHVSGAHLVYDHGDDELIEAHVGGEPVDPEARYRLATSEFLLYTDEEFPTLTDRERLRTLDVQYEVLAAYARTVGIEPERDGRIVRNGL